MKPISICTSCEIEHGPLKINLPRLKSQLGGGGTSIAGTIDICKRNSCVYKKRKVTRTSEFVIAEKRANTDHILIFLKSMLDIIDKGGMKGGFMEMNNVSNL